jgi:hypothetical protein
MLHEPRPACRSRSDGILMGSSTAGADERLSVFERMPVANILAHREKEIIRLRSLCAGFPSVKIRVSRVVVVRALAGWRYPSFVGRASEWTLRKRMK